MNNILLNQDTNTLIARSQEQRAQFETDMAVIMALDENSSLEQLYDAREVLNDEIKNRETGNKMGLHTAQLKIMGLIKNRGGSWA